MAVKIKLNDCFAFYTLNTSTKKNTLPLRAFFSEMNCFLLVCLRFCFGLWNDKSHVIRGGLRFYKQHEGQEIEKAVHGGVDGF